MIETENINGLYLINNFLNNLEEKELLENIYNNIWVNSINPSGILNVHPPFLENFLFLYYIYNDQ